MITVKMIVQSKMHRLAFFASLKYQEVMNRIIPLRRTARRYGVWSDTLLLLYLLGLAVVLFASGVSAIALRLHEFWPIAILSIAIACVFGAVAWLLVPHLIAKWVRNSQELDQSDELPLDPKLYSVQDVA